MSILKKLLVASACSATMMCAASANASVMTVGNLSTNTQTHLSTDTVSGRSYTRLDAFDLTYAGTLAATAPGGAWAGWSIATAQVSDAFIAAALGVASTPCTGYVAYATTCGTISGWSDGKLGASYNGYSDYYVYLNRNGSAGLVGLNGAVRDYEDWSSLTAIDYYYKGANPINYLLYKEAGAAVPEPVSLALFGLGLAALGLGMRRRRG